MWRTEQNRRLWCCGRVERPQTQLCSLTEVGKRFGVPRKGREPLPEQIKGFI